MRTMAIIGAIFLSLLLGQAQAAETINIVHVDPFSGPFKDDGDRASMGVQFAVDEINAAGGLLGKKVRYLPEDSQVKPDIGARKAEKAITQDNAQFIIQNVSTAVARALKQVAEKHKKIFVTTGALSDYLTGREFNRYFFRTIANTANLSKAYGEFLKTKPWRKIYLINMDYAYGHAIAEDFKKIVKAQIPDVQIVGEDFHPMATKDFGPYISKILASGAEVIYTGNYGPDLEILLKQGNSMGVKARYLTNLLDNPAICASLGDVAIGNFVSALWLPTIETKENKDFLERWHQKFKGSKNPWPAYVTGGAYNGARWLFEVVKKANSTDAEAIIKAWEGMKFESLFGEQVMRACDHQSLQPGFIAEVQAKSELFDFPYVGKPIVIPVEKVVVPPQETENPRCN